VGTLETPRLKELRERVSALTTDDAPTRVTCIAVDVRELHGKAANAGALFQVASQFNLLEMVGPHVTPEEGVTRYEADGTQGPACAIAAGAATIYRNYMVPVGSGLGQHAGEQIDCLADLGRSLGNRNDRLWQMRNGYALCSSEGLGLIDRHLQGLGEPGLDELRGHLRIGLHWQVDVTDMPEPGHRVSQAFCSALPVAYSDLASQRWESFARVVLEGAYEATMLAAVLNRAKHGSAAVFLTRLGGGAFGNETEWIHDAIRRALTLVRGAGLDVRLVSHGGVPADLQALAAEFA
jgi:hypothetical protein